MAHKKKWASQKQWWENEVERKKKETNLKSMCVFPLFVSFDLLIFFKFSHVCDFEAQALAMVDARSSKHFSIFVFTSHIKSI